MQFSLNIGTFLWERRSIPNGHCEGAVVFMTTASTVEAYCLYGLEFNLMEGHCAHTIVYGELGLALMDGLSIVEILR